MCGYMEGYIKLYIYLKKNDLDFFFCVTSISCLSEYVVFCHFKASGFGPKDSVILEH